jgi:hypothetical protein
MERKAHSTGISTSGENKNYLYTYIHTDVRTYIHTYIRISIFRSTKSNLAAVFDIQVFVNL